MDNRGTKRLTFVLYRFMILTDSTLFKTKKKVHLKSDLFPSTFCNSLMFVPSLGGGGGGGGFVPYLQRDMDKS